MELDINNVINILNAEWANDMMENKKRVAILQEENGRLKQEIENLKSPKKENAE